MSQITSAEALTAPESPYWLVLSNSGEIDLRLITTMGVNVKPNSPRPIGEFGTGLKIALSVVMRLGGAVQIARGAEVFTLGRKEIEIRGKAFELLTLCGPNGAQVELPYTTELGKKWQPWMAFREFWSNMLDENGEGALCAGLVPEPEMTQIAIKCPQITAAYLERERYFLGDRVPLWESETFALYEGPSQALFFRGIRVGELQKPSRWIWNLKQGATLTEDRTVDGFSFRWAIQQALLREVPPQIKEILTMPQQFWESELDFDLYQKPSETFTVAVAECHLKKFGTLNQSAWRKCRAELPEAEPEIALLDAAEEDVLERAERFITTLGIKMESRVEVVESLGDHRLVGFTHLNSKRIWISRAAFAHGAKFVATTLLEEYCHAELGLKDYSREMQDWLLALVATLQERLDGKGL